ncbi:hypothetical protein V6N13_016783 [Hibiscus sabdariffa]|uniref:Uncharacterized protein n=1 Tax=Hibiscus sabdariffa TaxID=183260 RepID=A0ABR2PTZ8_9ROSI
MAFPFSLPPTLKRPNSLFSTQTNLKSCWIAISDEWTALAVKRRRSSRKFGLVKGDGCLKKFVGWRFETRIDGFSLDDNGSWDPGQTLPVTPKLFQPLELYENSGKLWGFESLSSGDQGAFGVFTVDLYAHFKWESYYIRGSMLWWRPFTVSVESFEAFLDFPLLADLKILFCLRVPSRSICKNVNVGEVEVRAFSFVEKKWGGLILPIGPASFVPTVLYVRVDNSSIFIGILLFWEGLVVLILLCYYKHCFHCEYLGVDFLQYGKVFSDIIFKVCSKIYIKDMSCLIAAEIFLPTELEIYWVPDVMGGENGIDFGFGMPFEQVFVLQGSGGKEVGLSTFYSLIEIEEVEPESSITLNTSSDNSKGKTADDLERDYPCPA